jgi:hypothetical protein
MRDLLAELNNKTATEAAADVNLDPQGRERKDRRR